jgi:hypothetical protein
LPPGNALLKARSAAPQAQRSSNLAAGNPPLLKRSAPRCFLPCDVAIAEVYGLLSAQLEEAGQSFADADLQMRYWMRENASRSRPNWFMSLQTRQMESTLDI